MPRKAAAKTKRASQKPKTKTATSNKYRSGFEERVAADLETRQIPFEYEGDRIYFYRKSHYKPDFKLPNGIYVETKGWMKSEDTGKHLLLKEQHPDLDVRFVFMSPKSKAGRSKLTVAQWCEKHGFQYAFHRIPEEWVNE